MRKTVIMLLFTVLLVGCNNSNMMEDVFHNEMKDMGNVNDYNLIKKVERDNIILFASSMDGGEENSNLHQIALFNKVDNKWLWEKITSCNDEWSGTFGNKPFILI